jgi:ADP-ribose pyrophosphatase
MSGADLATTPWVRRSRRPVYQNRWITVVEDVVDLPNGHHTLYGVVRCAPAVGVLPFVDDDHVLLVQQYRYVAGHPTWEMPTGGSHPGESLAETAQRELAEEAGYRARTLAPLTHFHTSKSVVEETAHLFVAHGLEPADAVPDPTELIRRRVWAFADVVELVARAEVTDSMTVVAVLHAERLRRSGRWPPAPAPPPEGTSG